MTQKTFILFLCICYLTSNAQGIEFFHGSFEEAKTLAKKENKIIFMDAFASWCGPCKRMAKNVFPTKEAGDYFNKNFINIKVDMEKGEGKKIAKKYRVRSYPTLLFLDYKGDIILETKGARSSAASLIQLGEKALAPNKNTLKALEKKWQNGERDLAFLNEYIQAKNLFKEDYNQAFATYIEALSPEEKNTEDVLDFVFRYTNNIKSAGLKYISNHKALYISELGKEVLDRKINKIALMSAQNAAKKKDGKSLLETKEFLKKWKPKNFKQQINFIDLKYYGITKDWDNYDKVVTKYLTKYKKTDDKAYKSVAWNYYMNIEEVKKLTKAEKWMQKAIALNNSYENNLTQSYLLYKLKRYSEAQDAVEYALILSKDSEKNTKNAQILKSKIEKALEGAKKDVIIEYEVE